MNDLPLFNKPPATGDNLPVHAPLSETSTAAARAALPTRARALREYYEALVRYGGLTDHEAAAVCHRPLSSINARRNELMKNFREPLVVDGGKRRETPYGMRAVVWEAVR